MATRTETELKVFLNGDYEDQYSKLTDKTGTVFFDKTRRAVYAEGVLITSDVVDVKVEGSKLKVKKVGESTYTEIADLAIPNVFVKFTENQGLSLAEQKFARANIGVKDAIDNLTSTDTIAPLSANQGKVLKGLIDTNTTKLAGIEEGAQKNRVITVNDNQLGDDEQKSAIKISGNLISLPNNGEGGEMAVNLYAEYSSTDKKIYFRNGDTEDASNLFTIDTTDFVRDGMVSGVTYDATNKNLVITFNTDSGKEAITVSLASLVDTYTAGDGITLAGNKFSANLGNGLQFDSTNPKKITLKPTANGGIKVDGNGVALQVVTNGGITVGANGAAVDWTKAPVLSVNGQTGAVTIDVTPKVWSF